METLGETGASGEWAGAAGRLGKTKTDERHLWREEAAALGWQHHTVMEGGVHKPLTEAERFDLAYAFAAWNLAQEFHTAAVISHEKLGMYAARGLIGAGIAGGPDDIRRVVELLEERGIRLRGEQVALVVGMFDGQVRVTNTAQIRIEEKLAATAEATARDKSEALSVQALGRAIAAAGIDFTEEQKAAIHALGQGGPLTLLTGVAGAGKTTVLQPLVAAWQADARSMILVPLRADGDTIGILNIESTAEAPLTDGDLRLSQAVADRLSTAILLGRQQQALAERARLFARLNDFAGHRPVAVLETRREKGR